MLFRKKQSTELLAGLDIGSSMVRLVAGYVSPGETSSSTYRLPIKIVGAAEVPAEGVHRGTVTSIEELISSISGALEQTERMVGAPIESVWVGVNGPAVMTQMSKGVVAVAKANGEIFPQDVDRVMLAAQAVPLPLNYDLLHVLPRSFSVDGQGGIKDPVGMTGMRLEVDTALLYGMSTHVKNLTRAVYRTGIEIDDVVLSILAAGEAVVTARQKELGVVVVNIGATTTSISVYENGDTIHVRILPIGSQHITNDIAVGLKVSIDNAEKIKKTFGHAVPKLVQKKDIIDVEAIGGGVGEVASRHFVSQIVAARVIEICEKVAEELAKIERTGLLPAGVVCLGGGAKIEGFVECAKNTLGLPVTLGYPVEVSSVANISSDISFVTAIGLLKWGAKIGGDGGDNRSPFARMHTWVEKIGKMKQWLVP